MTIVSWLFWVSAGKEKEQRLEDYRQRFWDAWKVTELDVLIICQFLVEMNIAVLDQPPPIHLILLSVTIFFPQALKNHKGSPFWWSRVQQKVTTTELRRILEEPFQQYTEAWERKTGKSIKLQGIILKGRRCSFLRSIKYIVCDISSVSFQSRTIYSWYDVM